MPDKIRFFDRCNVVALKGPVFLLELIGERGGKMRVAVPKRVSAKLIAAIKKASK